MSIGFWTIVTVNIYPFSSFSFWLLLENFAREM